MELLQIMKNRRSIRKYNDDKISTDKLNMILRAGLLAPSSKNIRPVELIVIEDKSTLEKLAKSKQAGAGMLSDASCAVVVIGDTETYNVLKDENVKFYPYNNIALYCDSKELEKLQEAINIYVTENEFEIEILNGDNLENIINLINCDDKKDIAVLLTTNSLNKEEFINKIKEKKTFVNENPFKSEVGTIYNYLN